jgi:hypothetical protein
MHECNESKSFEIENNNDTNDATGAIIELSEGDYHVYSD